MDDRLIDDENLTLEERSILPRKGFFIPDSIREVEREKEFESRLSEQDVVMLVDGDADGLACVIVGMRSYGFDFETGREAVEGKLLDKESDVDGEDEELDRDELLEEEIDDEVGAREVRMVSSYEGNGVKEMGYAYTSPNEFEDSVEHLVDNVKEGATVYIADLALDYLEEGSERHELLKELAEGREVYWYDHHQWDDETVEKLEDIGIEVVIGESDEECSADVTLREFEKRGYEFDDSTRELIAVTRDHDLWIKEDERSDDLADLSVYLGPDEYMSAVIDGPELGEEYAEFLREKREEKNNLIELAVERAWFEEIDEINVAHTYGRCSQNEVAEKLRQKGADAAVVVKPEGGISLRGSDGFEKCHLVAKKLNGGGHPKAAGCKPDVFDTLLDYADHWVNRGMKARQAVLDAFEEVIEEEFED